MGGGCVRSAIGGSTIGRAQGISSTAHSQQGSPDPALSIPMRPLSLAIEERADQLGININLSYDVGSDGSDDAQ